MDRGGKIPAVQILATGTDAPSRFGIRAWFRGRAMSAAGGTGLGKSEGASGRSPEGVTFRVARRPLARLSFVVAG
ncbi:hypothetical protein JCM9534A_79820 [Catenuloplanes indicus JCM 9534]|uniref:Uncharacterized protein n=1 Tax=Catenuloplanes indicus TaxID=137267 RepID=A0AAE3W589_9ACTN|nr:hypothetical protein [Catenuloplanes indicus]